MTKGTNPRGGNGVLACVLLAAAVFFGHLILMSGHLMSPDEELLFRTAESLATKGHLAIQPIEVDGEGNLLVRPDQTFATVPDKDGAFHAQYLPLQPLLAVPLVRLADLTAPVFAEWFTGTLPNTAVHERKPPADSWRRGVVVMLFNPLVAALTALVILRLVTLLTENRRAGFGAALLWAFTTVAWPHSRTWFTEPLAGLFGLLACERILTWFLISPGPESARRRAVLSVQIGGTLAAAIWTRMDSPFIALGLGLCMLGTDLFMRRRGARSGVFPFADYAIAGALVAGSFIALNVFNAWRFDLPFAPFGGYGDQSEGVKFSTDPLVGLHGVLFSPGKGLFYFSPGLLLALWGWTCVPKEKRWVTVIVLLSWLPFTLAMALWQNWDGGWCWGPRHLVQIHAPLMVGTGLLFTHLSSVRRIAIGVVAGIGIGVQFFGALQSPMDFYHEMFRTPADGEYYRVAYRPFEVQGMSPFFDVYARTPQTNYQPVPVSPALMPAPMVESLYVPQHTQWAGYPAMFKMGYCDWWLLARLVGPSEITEYGLPGESAP